MAGVLLGLGKARADCTDGDGPSVPNPAIYSIINHLPHFGGPPYSSRTSRKAAWLRWRIGLCLHAFGLNWGRDLVRRPARFPQSFWTFCSWFPLWPKPALFETVWDRRRRIWRSEHMQDGSIVTIADNANLPTRLVEPGFLGCECPGCIAVSGERCQNQVMSLDQPLSRCFLCSDALKETVADVTKGEWVGCMCQCGACRRSFECEVTDKVSAQLWDLAEGLCHDVECARSICRGKSCVPDLSLLPKPIRPPPEVSLEEYNMWWSHM